MVDDMWNRKSGSRERLLADVLEGMEWIMSAQDDINAAVATVNDLLAKVNDAAAKLNADVAALQGMEKVDTSGLNASVANVAAAGQNLDGAVAGVAGLVPAAPAPVEPAPAA